MKITYYGQNSILIDTGKFRLFVDPATSVNPWAKHINFSEINANYILLTHANGDHIADEEELSTKNQATVITNYQVATYFSK